VFRYLFLIASATALKIGLYGTIVLLLGLEDNAALDISRSPAIRVGDGLLGVTCFTASFFLVKCFCDFLVKHQNDRSTISSPINVRLP
jgi:hypothetical protein